MTAAHDMGGRPNDQPIDMSERPRMEWESRAHALVDVLCEKRVITSDELRRGIETLSTQDYQRLSYYERWSASLELLLVEKGLLNAEEVAERATALKERWV